MLSVTSQILVLCLLAPAADPAAKPALQPARIEAFLRLCETSRRGAILQLEHTLRGLRSQGSKSPEVTRQIVKIEENLRVLRANKEPLVPALTFPPEVGAIGRLPRLACHVEQILSEREMLVRCNFPVKVTTVRHFQARDEKVVQAVTFLMRGVPTSDAHEGADLEVTQVLEITGKQTYQTVEGRPSTVWVASDFDMTVIQTYFRQSAAGQR
jgi:hypothetical protein